MQQAFALSRKCEREISGYDEIFGARLKPRSHTHTINLKINHSLGRNDSEGKAAAAAREPNYSKSNLKRKNEELKSQASMREEKERKIDRMKQQPN